jgi:hypothetical protein
MFASKLVTTMELIIALLLTFGIIRNCDDIETIKSQPTDVTGSITQSDEYKKAILLQDKASVDALWQKELAEFFN